MPEAMTPTRHSSSSTLPPAARDPATASIRPRNRRLISTLDDAGSSSALSNPTRTPSRGASPIPSARIGSVTGRNNSGAEVVRSNPRGKSPSIGRGLLDGSWAPSWASVQELASSLLTGGASVSNGEGNRPGSREGGRPRKPVGQMSRWDGRRDDSWGPAPPMEPRPRPDDIAAGSVSSRDATLTALRTASVLESHDGVNGGLDVTGRFKKRRSDENLRETMQNQETEEYLAYVHHVRPTDTYAGIVLKYRCREDAFRKANGLWSQDNIQVRKWLALPVDACEVRGRPCAPPMSPSSKVDLLSRTPEATDPFGRDGQPAQDGFFVGAANGHSDQTSAEEDNKPWTHVRWVAIDSHPHPVEVARVPRKALGYFPPRRKKSIHTTSTLSTPRASTDLPTSEQPAAAATESPRSTSSRRPSLLSHHRGASTASTTRSTRLNSVGTADDPRRVPAWMRRPGGVGSLGRHVRAPGPERDYFNTWTNRHLPGLNIDSLPSMSVMGSESARFGFAPPGDDAPVAIVESPFEDGRDAASASRQGTGLDKAAAAVESWIRGAFERARQGPLTPVLGPRGRQGVGGGGGGGGVGGLPDMGGDLIELADAGSEDGRLESSAWDTGGLFASLPGPASSGGAASGSSPGQWAVGVRGRAGAAPKNNKAD